MKTKFSPKFYRQYAKQKSASYVIMKVTCSDARLLYSTGYALTQTDWSTARQYPKDYDHLREAADRIDQLKGWVKSFTKGKTEVLRDDLRSHLEILDGKKKANDKPQDKPKGEFFIAVEKMIQDAENGKVLQKKGKKKGERFGPGTLIIWKSALNKLSKFKPDLTFEDNTKEVYDEFLEWADKNKLGKSYTDKLIKDWRCFFLYCNKPVPTAFERLPIEKPTKPYLNPAEIELLYKLKLTNRTDEEIRDRYIVDLYTGLRISDMKTLDDENRIVNDNTIVYKKTQKIPIDIAIPIHSKVRAIRTKYGNKFPPQHHEHTINERMRKICALAGINSKVELVVADMNSYLRARLIKEKYMDGTERTVWIPKYELVSNHTARRSMITNMLRSGIEINQARRITGSSLSTLMTYDKTTAMENADDVRNHAFFQN